MHPNKHFRKTQRSACIDFVRERAFGVLTINGESAPLTSSVPAMLSEDGQKLEFHLVRTNPIAKQLGGNQKAVYLVSGPDSYVSPDWYGIDDQVPTWNYIAVRLEGIVSALPQSDLLPLLDRLSAHFENRLHPKPPWLTTKVNADALQQMMLSIVPFEMQVEQIDSTWKLNQNKADEVRAAAARQVGKSGIGLGVDELSRQMENAGRSD